MSHSGSLVKGIIVFWFVFWLYFLYFIYFLFLFY